MPEPAPSLPTGTVTFLFTDIEGSTNLARTLGDRWADVLEEHNRILRQAIRGHHGIDVRTEGDAVFAVFPSTLDAVEAAAQAQGELAAHAWPEEGLVRVRMGMHTGEGRLGGDEYVGLDVHRAARIAAAGHGGQVLVSEATRALVVEAIPDGLTLRDLGEHRLKDFDQPQRIHQLVIDGLPADFPSLRTLGVPSNLPVQLTTFVGRERELSEVAALLGGSRLLTLAGPGGSGKTRLAVEAARRNTDSYGDGVFFVDLSPIRDPALVASAIASALGLKEYPGRSALEAVVAHLRDRQALLILDNYEQVVASAPLVAELLGSAPRIAVLITSRIRLDLLGEQEFPVPPLGLPAAAADPAVLAENEAVALFRDRARAVLPTFEITQATAPVVAQICARLDGLPLAIELAAAQLRLLNPRELLARLEHRLPLRTGAGNVPERQRTLRGTIEWSYQLLGEPQRTLFSRLSVFLGGATPSAIQAICVRDGDSEMQTLHGLASLLDHSLVRRQDFAEGSRFTMLETIREFAGETLQSEFDLEETAGRHAEFFAAFAEEWGPAVRSQNAMDATATLVRDHDNIRAAIDWTIRRDRADLGLRIVSPMWMFWVEQGHIAEGRRAVQAELALPSAGVLTGMRAKGLGALGALAYWHVQYQEAARAYEEALEINLELGDMGGAARSRNDLVYALLAQAKPEAALPLIEASREALQTTGDPHMAAEVTGLLGIARAHMGDHLGALEALRESLAGFERVGGAAPTWVGEAKSRVGAVLRLMGRLDEAQQYLVEGLLSGRALAGNIAVTAVARQFGAVAWDRGDRERALRLFGFSVAVAERIGGAPPTALMLVRDPLAYRELARAEMDDASIQRLWAEGAAMSPDEAIAYALGEP